MLVKPDSEGRRLGELVGDREIGETIDVTVDEPVPGTTHYASAKGGLHGMLPSLVGELGPAGIGVNIVQPALTTTENNLKRIPEEMRDMVAACAATRHLSTAEDVAAAIVFVTSPSLDGKSCCMVLL
jgi:NAD(P)-dependent dehydrogenase (short-subunit alcohol dehydrogenase family)